jgi:hypothetical protein
LEQFSLADIHLTNAQTISIGVLLSRLDFTHHHFTEGGCDRLHFFDLQTSHCQGVSELLGVDGWVAKFSQPRFRKLHEVA